MSTSSSISRARGEASTHTLDLTKEGVRLEETSSSSTPTLKRPQTNYNHHTIRHSHFSTAYHRVISRQERQYNRQNPDLVQERLDIAEESRHHPSQDRLYNHLSRAAIAIGYTHATIVVISSAIFVVFLLALSFAVASDIFRKTRDRAVTFSSAAAECASNLRSHQCVVTQDGTYHESSHEMTRLCKEWYACAQRGRFAKADAWSAKIWAETFADIVNAFTERLSTSTMVILAVVVFLLSFLCTSTAFSIFHRRASVEQVADSIYSPRHEASPVPNRKWQRLPQTPTPTRRAISYDSPSPKRER